MGRFAEIFLPADQNSTGKDLDVEIDLPEGMSAAEDVNRFIETQLIKRGLKRAIEPMLINDKGRKDLPIDTPTEFDSMPVGENSFLGGRMPNQSETRNIPKNVLPPVEGMGQLSDLEKASLPYPVGQTGTTREKVIRNLPLLFSLGGASMTRPIQKELAESLVGNVLKPRAGGALDIGISGGQSVFAPIAAPALANITKKGAELGLRATPPALGAQAGGFTGSLAEQAIEDGVLSKIGTGELELPSDEEFKKIFDTAKRESQSMYLLTLGGETVASGISRLFAPNAYKLTPESRKAIEFARENNLPLMPSTLTGNNKTLEGVVEALAFTGKKSGGVEEMTRLLQAPSSDANLFINNIIQFTAKNAANKAEALPVAKQQANDFISSLIQKSTFTDEALAKAATTKETGVGTVFIDGSKLKTAITEAEKSGQFNKLNIKGEELEALKKFALYSERVMADVKNKSLLKGRSPIKGGAIAATGFAATTLPLFLTGEGLSGELTTPASGATSKEAATAGAIALATQMLSRNITNVKSPIHKWLVQGYLTAPTAKEVIRQMSVNAARSKSDELKTAGEYTTKGLEMLKPGKDAVMGKARELMTDQLIKNFSPNAL